jgi:type I restriction enzyme S subunit
VVGGKIDIGDLKFLKTSTKTADSIRLAVGDLLFVRTNGRREYTGRCAVFKGELREALFASYLIRARLKPDILLPDFAQLYTEIDEGRGQLSGRASGAADGKFNINTQTIRAVLAPCPSLDEQREIIHILQTVDAKITAAERKRVGLEELFQAMLGELMTGRVRVKGLAEGLTGMST